MARRTKTWRITGNVGDGNTLQTLASVQGFTDFAIHTIAGSVRVLPSLGNVQGTEDPLFSTTPLVLAQEPTITAEIPEPEGSFAVNTTVERLAWFDGDFRALRIIQEGGAAVDIILRAGGDA